MMEKFYNSFQSNLQTYLYEEMFEINLSSIYIVKNWHKLSLKLLINARQAESCTRVSACIAVCFTHLLFFILHFYIQYYAESL